MTLGQEGVTVVFNGEIYNHVELRRGLEVRGHKFRSSSDTEVLLRLYIEHGDAFVSRLRGMFAFAIWDERAGGLLLGRDPYGIKPLYVADDGRSVQAASQVRALLAMGGVDTSLEPAGHVGFFLWGSVPEPYTLYRGVRAFPPGHTQWFRSSGAGPARAFSTVPDILRAAEAAKPATVPDGAVREALVDTVRAHLVADVEVGVFLSAGRDSSTLAALATEVGGRLRSVTLGFDEYSGTDDDEVPLAETAAQHYQTDHRTVRVGRQEFAGLADTFFSSMDQPTIDGLNTYLVSRAAAEAGLKVVLSGLGGDELFGGYPSFSEVPRLARTLGRIPGHRTLGRGVRTVAAPALGRITSPKAAGLLEYGGTVAGAYLLRRALFMPYELAGVLGQDLAYAGLEALDPLGALDEFANGLESDRLRVTALESCQYMRSQLLRDSDWASMAHSLELRVPFVDVELLRRLAPLVAAQPGDVTKATLALSARPPLPPAIADRAKTGFTTPVRDWLTQTMEDAPSDRGLRGWARVVYRRMTAEA